MGRSMDFWTHFYPKLQDVFPAQLGAVPVGTFHQAINKVERSLIRTDADELTYNLHVMIRFGLELDMLEGRLAVKDLPDAWNARYAREISASSRPTTVTAVCRTCTGTGAPSAASSRVTPWATS